MDRIRSRPPVLGRVVMPGRFAVHEIGEDYVLGYTWDDLDVEYVEVYRLVRPRTTVRGDSPTSPGGANHAD